MGDDLKAQIAQHNRHIIAGLGLAVHILSILQSLEGQEPAVEHCLLRLQDLGHLATQLLQAVALLLQQPLTVGLGIPAFGHLAMPCAEGLADVNEDGGQLPPLAAAQGASDDDHGVLGA